MMKQSRPATDNNKTIPSDARNSIPWVVGTRHDPRYVESDDPSARLRAWAHGWTDMGGWAGPPSTDGEFLAAIMDELAYAGVVGDYCNSDGEDLSTSEADIEIEEVEAEEEEEEEEEDQT